MANGVRKHVVTYVSHRCITAWNFFAYSKFQVTPQIKLQRVKSGATPQALAVTSNEQRTAVVATLFYPMVVDLWDTLYIEYEA